MKPVDFTVSQLNSTLTIGADIKLITKRFTHVLSVQSIELGPSFTFRNMYFNQGFIPSSSGHHSASSIGQALISYGIEDTYGKRKVRLQYSLQAGIGANKSKEAYDIVLAPDSYGRQAGDHYIGYLTRYKRSGLGVFLSGKTGISLYNKRNKNTVNLQLFWHQGLKKMAEYSIYYEYGYFSRPEYQRQQQVLIKSKGTVFGVTVGIPIGVWKGKQVSAGKNEASL